MVQLLNLGNSLCLMMVDMGCPPFLKNDLVFQADNTL
jgi:hypothetical protein